MMVEEGLNFVMGEVMRCEEKFRCTNIDGKELLEVLCDHTVDYDDPLIFSVESESFLKHIFFLKDLNSHGAG